VCFFLFYFFKNLSTQNLNKELVTVIFDFDDTLVQDAALLEVINVAAGGNQDKIDSIKQLIKERKQNGKPVIQTILLEISEILGKSITVDDFKKASKNLESLLTPNIKDVIKTIKDNNHKVLIIGGAYSTCDILKDIGMFLGVDAVDIFSGATSFDENGVLVFSELKNGYSNCSTDQRITKDWIKSDAIKFLKAQGTIKGKVLHIGDGENDLEVWTARQVDVFIGFGINKINNKVKAEAPIFVETIDEFKTQINKILGI
jgi:HAD superfamily phosphoserine phosphatase-like hydrolase